MAHATEHAALPEQQHGLTPRQYILIGLALTVITVIELGVSYSGIGSLMIPILIVLSAVKFAVVVAYFMHLRFESGLMTRVFVGSFTLAALILIALLVIFWADLAPGIRANRVEPAATAAPR
jgi:cytochrome c oxidase subunit IV